MAGLEWMKAVSAAASRIALLLALATAAFAAETPKISVTHHQGTFNGVSLHYTARVQDNFVADASGKPGASIITIAYTRDGVKELKKRPVIFFFNGGPGASSSPLHFGGMGPYIRTGKGGIAVADTPSSQKTWKENPHSLIDSADLVFIDPVGTGFSRPFAGVDGKYWYDGKNDAVAVQEVIARWLKDNHRMASPRYLAGESYGTTRAGLILKYVPEFTYDGVLLIALVGEARGEDMPYVTSLPTMAASAWYHNKIDRAGRSAEQVYDEANAFAQTVYVSALIKGASLPPDEKQKIAERMSALIGLPADFIAAHDLRISKNDFMFTLLKDKGLRTGLLDTRVTAVLEPGAEGAIDDPALGVVPKRPAGSANKPIDVAALGGIPNQALKDYLDQELHFRSDEKYIAVNFAVNAAWQYAGRDDRGMPSLSSTAAVGEAMARQKSLRIFWANGLYDLTTPAAAGRYGLDHGGIAPERLTAVLFNGPHGVYEGEENLIAFTKAVRAFIKSPTLH